MACAEFSAELLSQLVADAEASPRLRMHHNIHADYGEPIQRLFNAIGEGSYIRPHRHLADCKVELLMAVRGRFALILFDDAGKPERCIFFGVSADDSAGAQIDPAIWHTVVALEKGAVLLEIKEGPFDPSLAKQLAEWSPEEGSCEAAAYLRELREWSGRLDHRKRSID